MTDLQSPHSVANADLAPIASARWRHLALSGAVVGSAVVSSAAMAGVVQITQVGNEATSSANKLQPDLSGDGMPDLEGLGVANNPPTTFVTTFKNAWTFDAKIEAFFDTPGKTHKRLGFAGHALFGIGKIPLQNQVQSIYFNTVGSNDNSPLEDASGMVPITFSDARINGGATTNALLEVRAISTSKASHTVRLVRLVFDDASTAAPTGPGTIAGTWAPEFGRVPFFLPPPVEEITTLTHQIAKLTKQLHKASKTKRKAIAKKIKRLRARLATLPFAHVYD